MYKRQVYGFETVACSSNVESGELTIPVISEAVSYTHLDVYKRQALDSFDGDDQMVAPAMIGAMGNCYAQPGQLDKAASMLLKAANAADNNSLSPIYLLQAGEILVKQGKYDEDVYKRQGQGIHLRIAKRVQV